MLQSQKLKNLLENLFAVSPLMERFALPGLIGIPLMALAWRSQIGWLKLTGFILIIPLLWIYSLILFVYIPFALFDHLRRKIKRP